ncbi:MAG: aryl-sulfate sulfotransferase [Methanomicrobiaceae archaeon]|nr:aryl-sulfate sulfotransferase [Methanomicrobiaceae archaeon]
MKCCCVLLFGFFILGLVLTSGCSQPGPQPQVSSPVQTDAGTLDFEQTTAAVTGTPAPVTDVQPRGTADPDFIVDISVPESIQPGTTILADNHDSASPRIIEVNRLGEIVWEYPLANDLKAYTNPGWDVEPLPNGNILTVLPGKGVYEINRDRQIVWSYSDRKVSHDADRLENGNTLVVYGAYDTKNDAQVKEVDSSGNIVWSWYAKDSFDRAPYASISNEGWTHTNAVTRLSNGNTLVSLRNFDLIAEVSPTGELVGTIGEGVLRSQHDPLVLPDGNILLANHIEPNEIIKMDLSGNVTWRYRILDRGSCPVRDANLLANGNFLIAESDRIIEMTNEKQIVWQFRLAAGPFTEMGSAPARGFYKAERIPL